LRNEDVIEIEIENAGRRCGVCRSGRGWRRFELVRPAGREPVVLCGGCRARFGDDPPVGRKPSSPVESVPAMAEPLVPPNRYPGDRGPDQHPDRLRAALGKLPGSFSTAMAARAAGINSRRALARLQDLERCGEVRRVGKRWSTESPPSDVAAAREEPENVVPAAEVIAPIKTENPTSAQDIPDADEEHTAAPALPEPRPPDEPGPPAVPHPTRLQRVRALQEQLIWLGFDPGPVDGRYGPWTTDAVKRFQLANDFEADGVVGAVTAEALRARSPDPPTRGRIERVKALQRQLSRLGLEPGLIDGRYGPLTTGAVKRFQEAHDLIVDGVVGPATAEALRASAPERPTTDRAERVRALQQQLSALGLEPGPVDGRYGPQTTDAVKRFQQANDLEPDGIVDPRMQHALQRSVLQHQNRS
jgi:peptidoglycan hydrolase-like protein with peptidoglycan-binding domain